MLRNKFKNIAFSLAIVMGIGVATPVFAKSDYNPGDILALGSDLTDAQEAALRKYFNAPDGTNTIYVTDEVIIEQLGLDPNDPANYAGGCYSSAYVKLLDDNSGINVFGKRIKSLVYTTDLAIIRNVNADAIWAVYPFTPQPIITQALLLASDIPVFTGVGGGLTSGLRSVMLGTNAEIQGAMGVVLNAPTSNETLKTLSSALDIPVIVSVISEDTDFEGRIKAGASILNVSASTDTPKIVAKIRKEYPKLPIIATGGPSDETILETIKAGANAITWSPPTVPTLFKKVMNSYRNNMEYFH